MDGKTIVVTGATSGIGLAACHAWAAQGAHLVLAGRDMNRLDAALKQLPKLSAAAHIGVLADMASQKKIRALAETLLERCPRIDVLFLNAGALYGKRETTEEGVEKTFAVNHLAPFLLTHLLRERLVASAPARVIVTASAAHRAARKLDLAGVKNPQSYTAFKAYRVSKLANILFASELARRLAGTGVTAYSFHPGVVATRFAADAGLITLGFKLIKPFLRSPEKAARTAVFLSEMPEKPDLNGRYFADSAPAQTTRLGSDADAARRLWDVSLAFCGLPPDAETTIR